MSNRLLTHAEAVEIALAAQRKLTEVTAERDALRADVPKWWHCNTHGGQQHAWGCAECVRELRTENARLAECLKKANSQTEEFERKWYLVKDERDALRAFAQEVMDGWPEFGGMDGGDLQDAAEKHGLLKPVMRYNPCSADCTCTDYYDPAEFGPGVCCYQLTPLLTGEPQETGK